jgi:hypothetical protein
MSGWGENRHQNLPLCASVGTSIITQSQKIFQRNSWQFQTQQHVLHHWQAVTLGPYHRNNDPWLPIHCADTYSYRFTHLPGAWSWLCCSSQSMVTCENGTAWPRPSGTQMEHNMSKQVWALQLNLHTAAVRKVHWGFIMWVLWRERNWKLWDSTTEIWKMLMVRW